MSDELTSEERTRRYMEARGVKLAPASAPEDTAPVSPAEDGVSQADLVRLFHLIAAGIVRTRKGPDGLVVERVPESHADRKRRLERKRKRQLKRRGRK